MITPTLLEKLGFTFEDSSYILENDILYGNVISTVAEEYMSQNGFDYIIPYSLNEFYEKRNLAENSIKRCRKLCSSCDNEYIIYLIFWLYCVPLAKKYYDKHNISDAVFYDTVSDLACKTNECKASYKKCGVSAISADWFALLFDFKVFALGRLQYFCETYSFNDYKFGNYTLKKGDTVYSCHIPSNGKLETNLCLESMQKAYDFFKPKLNSTILPIICESWLLYPPYVNEVFIQDGNIVKFAKLFDITETISSGREFLDCPRVFSKWYNGSTEGFASDTPLKRNFIKYIDSGRDFGYGLGIILYDGEKKQIINKA